MRGRVLADRFVLGEQIGRGGMGAVHRATDRESGQDVAVKILLPWVKDERATARFEREAALLASVEHAAIVSYVGHGLEEDGARFLAMEWIGGVDLEQHLAEAAPLDIEDALALAEEVARALGCLHAADAVHRDVKPSNILLRDGDVRRPVLADFGIALVEGLKATKAGSIVGTLGYMAPEQARGERASAQTDVFALGCVLYECLSGEPAFTGESPRALALKILVADVVPLSQLLTLPFAVERLVSRMLAKEREDRPKDGAALAAELSSIRDRSSRETPSFTPPVRSSPRITTNERQLVTTVLFPGAAESFSDTATMDVLPEADPALEPTLAVAGRLRGRTAQLRDGTLLVFFEGIGDARDQAANAARVALAGRGALLDGGAAVATGVAELAGYLPTGAAIDRAAALVKNADAGEIVVDEISARLLGRDFLVERAGDHYRLEAARTVDGTAPYRLLGRPTEVIGRERPLRKVESLLRRSISASEPSSVLVTGPSGMGKSRFLFEVERRLVQLTPRLLVLRARANPASQDEAFSLVVQLLRSVLDGSAVGLDSIAGGEGFEGEEFVAELLRLPVEEPSVQLRTAREDPRLMGDQVRRALLELLIRSASRQSMLLLPDDLHFADDASLDLLARALGEERGGALVIVAASRAPLPTGRSWPDLNEVALHPLSVDACIEVVRNALGDVVDDDRATLLVERSEGNPFWLEELVRMEAAGPTDALPESVVASVQARLERMPADARRLLRAASVFGLEFPVAPAAALAGLSREQLDVCLGALTDSDLIFPGPMGTYDLRHDVVRRAAYEMLTESDRKAAHGAAAAWFEGLEEHDPRLVADHFELAGLSDKAIRHHGEAAEVALGFSDFPGAMDRAARGLSGASDDETRGWLHHVRAEAAYWAGEPALAVEHAREVERLTERATPRWLDAKRIESAVAVRKGQMAKVLEVARDVADVDAAHGAARDLAATAARLASHSFLAGDGELAKRLLEKAESYASGHGGDFALAATIHDARGRRAELGRDYVGERRERQAAGDIFDAIGDRRRECIARANLGVAEMHMGLHEASRASLETARSLAIDLGVGAAAAAAECNLGHVLALVGEHALGRTMLAASAARSRATGNRRFEGACAAHLARLELSVDRTAEALRAADEATVLLDNAPTLYGYALATKAEALLAHEEPERALALAEQATRDARAGILEEGDIYARVVHARVCAALGEVDEARSLLAEVLEEIEARARHFDDAEYRRAYLEQIPENAEAASLARHLTEV